MNTQPSLHNRLSTLVLSAVLVCLTAPVLPAPALVEATLPLQEIAKTSYPGLNPEQVVARMIADGGHPLLSAKAVAQISPPQAAPSIAASAASAVPQAAPDIAAAVAGVAPDQAVAIAVTVGKAVPDMAPQIAATVAQVAPELAAQIVQAMAQAVPQAASAISTAVAGAVPGFSVAAISAPVLGGVVAAAGAVGAAVLNATGVLGNNAAPFVVAPCLPDFNLKDYRKLCSTHLENQYVCNGDPAIVYSRVDTYNAYKAISGGAVCMDVSRGKETRSIICTPRVCVTRAPTLIRNWCPPGLTIAHENAECGCPDKCNPPRILNAQTCACECPQCPAPRILNAQTCDCNCPPCTSPYKSSGNCNCVIAQDGDNSETRLSLADTPQNNSGVCACQQCSRTKTSMDGTAGSVDERLIH